MKKLLLTAAVAAAGFAFAEEAAKTANHEAEPAPQVEEKDDPLFWGFGNYGIYSGYQLYGSLLNSEPTLQGYLEANINLSVKGWDLGYLGIGAWCNTDLTDKRRDLYGKAFNEWDPNVHYGKTFWFDDEDKWGLDYRTSIVWYYYPHGRGHDYNSRGQGHFQYGHDTMTTMDWNHSFAFVNPFVTPFLDWIHEYHENNADLLQFGLKRVCGVTDAFTLTPSVTFVYRDHRYNWCFPTAGWTGTHNGGIATAKLMLEANYQVCDHFGLFAKVAYCSIVDHDLRDAAEHGSGGDYGQYKDYAWGGLGVTVNF